jgi:hypothetical protein
LIDRREAFGASQACKVLYDISSVRVIASNNASRSSPIITHGTSDRRIEVLFKQLASLRQILPIVDFGISGYFPWILL